MNRDDLIAHLRFARENMCLNCTYGDILEQAIEMIKAQDVTPEELERLKKCRHDCKIECLLEEYDRVKNERDALLKAQEPRVMTLDLPPEEWQDKVIWLEIKGEKPIPCLFRKCCDRMMFGRYERIMSFDAIGSSKEGGYFLRNYGVKWRCWTSRPTDEQREATPWNV